MTKPTLHTYEIQHLSGRRILGSFTVKAKDMAGADRKTKARRKREGWTRYRIAKVDPAKPRPRHGGHHQSGTLALMQQLHGGKVTR